VIVRHPATWVDLGRRDYLSALALQERLRELRLADEIPDTLVLVEHSPCVTVGRSGTPSHILASATELAEAGIDLHLSDRGGDVTYHGPGQLVCYPVVDLRDYGRDLHAHVRRLEALMIETAAAFDVLAWRRSGLPGVWTRPGKLGAVGVAVNGWVTTHGTALNVSVDLWPYSLIVPCGLSGIAVTSMAQVLGYAPGLGDVREAARNAFEKVFARSLRACETSSPLTQALEELDCLECVLPG
jgi:lipoate-protein ligase B